MAIAELDPHRLAGDIVEAHRDEASWLDEFADAFEQRRAGQPLARVLAVWGLSQADVARRFGVSRQAISKWVAGGPPAERAEAVADLAAATDLLVRHLKRDRIPAVVRRPAAALGRESLLDRWERAGSRSVLDACRAMFDFDQAHV